MSARECWHPQQDDPIPSTSTTALATFSAVGVILLLGAGAAYFLSRAGAEALATAGRLLVTTGLVGLVVLALVVAARSSRRPVPERHGGGGPGRHAPRLVPVHSPNPDAELIRILDDDRFGDISKNLRGSRHSRRGVA